MDMKQATSLSLRSLNHETTTTTTSYRMTTTTTNCGSYLKSYLDKQQPISAKKKKLMHESSRFMSCDDLGIFEVDTEMGDESDTGGVSDDANGKMIKKIASFFPRTAPAAANFTNSNGGPAAVGGSLDNLGMLPNIIRKSYENMNGGMSASASLSSSSSSVLKGLVKREKEKTDDKLIKSLRV